MTTTEHQVPDLGQVQINAAGLNALMVTHIKHSIVHMHGFFFW